jgi:hypothetical protein
MTPAAPRKGDSPHWQRGHRQGWSKYQFVKHKIHFIPSSTMAAVFGTL